MRLYIYAYEDLYNGKGGIYDYFVGEFKDVAEAEHLGTDMAENLIYDYDLEDQYREFKEDGIEVSPEYDIFKIKDSCCSDMKTLTIEADSLVPTEFIEKYCERI